MQAPTLLLIVVVAGGFALGATDALTTVMPTGDEGGALGTAVAPRAWVALASAGSMLTDDGLAAIDHLTEQLGKLDGVERAQSATTLRRPRLLHSGGIAWTTLPRRLPSKPLEASAWRARVLRDPLLIPRALSVDGRTARIEVTPEPNVVLHELWAKVEARVAEAPLPNGVRAQLFVDEGRRRSPLSRLQRPVAARDAKTWLALGLLLLVMLAAATRGAKRFGVCVGMALVPAAALVPLLADDPPLDDLPLYLLPSLVGWVLSMVLTAPEPRAPGLTFATSSSVRSRVLRPGAWGPLLVGIAVVSTLAVLSTRKEFPASDALSAVVPLTAWVVGACVGLAALWNPRRVAAPHGTRPTSRLSGVVAWGLTTSLMLLPAAAPALLVHRSEDPASSVLAQANGAELAVHVEGPAGWLDTPSVAQRLLAFEQGRGLPDDVVITTGPATILARVAGAIAELPEGRVAPFPDEPDALRALWVLAADHPDLVRLVDPRRRRVTWRVSTATRSDAQLLERVQTLRETLLSPASWPKGAAPERVVVDGTHLARADRAAEGRRVAVAVLLALALLLSLSSSLLARETRRWPGEAAVVCTPLLAAGAWDAASPSSTWALIVVLGVSVLGLGAVAWRRAALARQLAQQGFTPPSARSSTRTGRLLLEISLPLVAVSTTGALIATSLGGLWRLPSVALGAAAVAYGLAALGPVASATVQDRPQT